MNALEKMLLLPMSLQLFDAVPNTNVTSDGGLTEEMKTYYSDYMIDNAEPELVHDQFGQKRPIPKNGGKTVQFRKYDSLPKALTPITEGITPDGGKLSMSVLSVTVDQYGYYVTLSDMLILTAIDNNVMEATQLLGAQAGRTMDTITREVLNGGTNVQFAEGQVSSRSELVGGAATDNMYLTVDCINRASRYLKTQNAKRIDGYFVGIVHPDCEYDVMHDPNWQYPHQYVDTDNIYEGEIGKVGGVRFVETTEAKVFHAKDLAKDARTLLVNGALSTAGTAINFDGGTVAPSSLVGRYVLIGANKVKVTANTATGLTVNPAITATDNAVIYPGEAGAAGRDVYATLVLGENAYGTTEITGGGMEHIVKQLGSGGTGDALNQRATVGWKATKAVIRLVEQYLLRIENCSTFESGAN